MSLVLTIILRTGGKLNKVEMQKRFPIEFKTS